MPISYKENVAEELRLSVLSYFRKNPRVSAYIKAIGRVAQAVEDDTFNGVLALMLDTAGGTVLESLASWWGEQRQGLNDEELRRVLFAKVRASRSNGELPALLDIIAALTDDEAPRAYPTYPAGFRIAFDTDASEAILRRLRRMFPDAVKVGVGNQLLKSSGFGFQLDNPDRGLDNGRLLEIL